MTLATPRLPLVIVDPGHGGTQDGAIGVCGAREKDITMAVGGELAALLRASGRARVLLTRVSDTDLELEDRAWLANQAKGDLFVSIHANASRMSSAYGVETYFLSRRASDRRIEQLAERENGGIDFSELLQQDDTLARILDGLRLSSAHGESQRLAGRLHSAMSEQLNSKARGVLQAPFVVLLKANMPAVLVEVGFLTHEDECGQLQQQEHQRSVARSLVSAILDHLAREHSVVARR